MGFSGTLEITTNMGCPMRCGYCPQATLRKAYQSPIRQMAFATFQACLRTVPENIRIDFSGMSEPWLNLECTRMLEYAVDRGHPIAVYTTLLGVSAADLDFLSRWEIDPLVIHLPDEGGNSSIPLTRTYLAVIRWFFQIMPDTPGWRNLRISCHGRLHPTLIKLFGDEIEATKIPVVDYLSDRAGNLSGRTLLHHRKEGPIACSSSGRTLNHNILLPDGRVILCCMDYGMQHILGNLLTQEYSDLFEGEEFRRLQAGLDGSEPAILCRKCVRAVPLHQQ